MPDEVITGFVSQYFFVPDSALHAVKDAPQYNALAPLLPRVQQMAQQLNPNYTDKEFFKQLFRGITSILHHTEPPHPEWAFPLFSTLKQQMLKTPPVPNSIENRFSRITVYQAHINADGTPQDILYADVEGAYSPFAVDPHAGSTACIMLAATPLMPERKITMREVLAGRPFFGVQEHAQLSGSIVGEDEGKWLTHCYHSGYGGYGSVDDDVYEGRLNSLRNSALAPAADLEKKLILHTALVEEQAYSTLTSDFSVRTIDDAAFMRIAKDFLRDDNAFSTAELDLLKTLAEPLKETLHVSRDDQNRITFKSQTLPNEILTGVLKR